MPLLGPTDTLERRPTRVIVAGTSGAGKTTVAAHIASVLSIEHVEIDALFHGPGWVKRQSFEAEVTSFTAGSGWVTEWQYPTVRSVLAERADLLVWLDVRRSTVMRQVTVRTLRRRLGRQELWNGNLEPPLWTTLTNPEHIIRWAWTTHDQTAQRVAVLRDRLPRLVIVRLVDRAAQDQWLTGPLLRSTQLRADD